MIITVYTKNHVFIHTNARYEMLDGVLIVHNNESEEVKSQVNRAYYPFSGLQYWTVG